MSYSFELNREGAEIEIDADSTEEASAKHVVMGSNSFRCLHCGVEQKIHMPCSIGVLVGASNGFIGEHKDCEPSAAGEARFEYSNEYEWRKSWDTGLSALTIFGVFTHSEHKPSIPRDAGDIGRCFRLLSVAPRNWRDDLQRVADAHPEWQPLVDRWDELEELYDEDRFEELYEVMKECERG